MNCPEWNRDDQGNCLDHPPANALDSPGCEDYHRRRPYSKRGAK